MVTSGINKCLFFAYICKWNIVDRCTGNWIWMKLSCTLLTDVKIKIAGKLILLYYAQISYTCNYLNYTKNIKICIFELCVTSMFPNALL